MKWDLQACIHAMRQLCCWRTSAWWLGCLCVLVSPAHAQADVLQPARHWLSDSLAQTQSTLPELKLSVSLGQLDPRLQLAPCQEIEPFLPAGSRLWGKTRIGLRCLQGAVKWQVFVPVQVRAMGAAWVLRRDVPAGAALSSEDLIRAEVDWAEDPSAVVTQSQAWATQVTVRALTTGQTLRQNLLRPAAVFQAGSLVRVMAQGGGFQVSADGQALGAGIPGQTVKVRMDNGRVLSGTVVDARTVKVDI